MCVWGLVDGLVFTILYQLTMVVPGRHAVTVTTSFGLSLFERGCDKRGNTKVEEN